jgi:hypothetical protein
MDPRQAMPQNRALLGSVGSFFLGEFMGSILSFWWIQRAAQKDYAKSLPSLAAGGHQGGLTKLSGPQPSDNAALSLPLEK